MLMFSFASLLLIFSLTVFKPPVWLEVGSFMEFRVKPEYITFTNLSYIDFESEATLIYRWQCIDIEDNIAVLNVTLRIIEKGKGVIFSKCIRINVNLYTNAITTQDGTFVGTLRFWLPPRLREETIIEMPINSSFWFENYSVDSFKGEVKSIEVGSTPQGRQKVALISWEIHYNKSIGRNRTIIKGLWDPFEIYDWDTGLLITFPTNDISLLLLGVANVYVVLLGPPNIYATNIDFGPALSSPWEFLIPFIFLTTFAVVCFVIYRQRTKRKLLRRRRLRTKLSPPDIRTGRS